MALLEFAACVAIGTGIAAALWIAWDETRRPQPMPVMNLVWPLVALAGGPFILWLYHRRASGHGKPSFALMTATATCHCGAGCTLGDILAETIMTAVPGIAVWLGLGTIFSVPIFANWILDYLLAFLLGIAFQYFSIAPMRGLGLREGLRAALEADSLSLTAWQAGMYGCMAVIQFGPAPLLLGRPLEAAMPLFWFAMQIAMIAGFATSYPVNWWLLKAGIKEKM